MNTAPECHPRAKAADEERTRPAALAHATRVTTLGELAASIAHEIDQPLAAIAVSRSIARSSAWDQLADLVGESFDVTTESPRFRRSCLRYAR
jgi:C4-dicarboxylate-specific signal transduction histidine kinase